MIFLANKIYSQQPKQIEIINANTLQFDENIGNGAKRLLGDVQFKHENALMFCDSAYYYDTNKIDAFGNVKIKQGDTLSLIGDVLYYDGNTKKAIIKNNIVMQDATMKLTTQILNYDLNTGIADYNGGGKIINKKTTLTSKYGYYYSKQKNLFFKENVKLVTDDYTINCDTLKHNTQTEISYFRGPTTIVSKANTIYCENGWYNNKADKAQFNKHAYFKGKTNTLSGDSLYYDRVLGYGKAICYVTLLDTVEKIILKGHLAEVFEKDDYSYVTDEALLMNYTKTDTLFLHADTLIATYDTTFFGAKKKLFPRKLDLRTPEKTKKKSSENQKIVVPFKPDNLALEKAKSDSIYLDSLREKHRLIKAFRGVRFFRKDLQAQCDSMAMTAVDSLIKLYKKPILWSEANQLTADEINITFFEGNVYRMKLKNSAFIISRTDSLRYNQIKGKNMFGYFIKNDLHKINVVGNGQTNYWIADEKKQLIGANHAECSSMIIMLNDGAVKKLSLLNKPDAILKPVKNLDPSSQLLEGFEWLNSLRPKTPLDVMKR